MPRLRRQSIRSWVNLFLISLSILGLGAVYFRHQVTVSRTMLEDQLAAISDLKSREIVQWRTERQSAAKQAMLDPFVGPRVTALLQQPDDPTLRASALQWLSSVCEHEQGLRALLLDGDLKVQVAVPENETFLGPVAISSAREALKKNAVVLSDVHLSRVSGKPLFDLAIPIRSTLSTPAEHASPAGTPVAVVLVEVDPYRFLYPCVRQWPVPSKTAECLLVRREADDVLYLNDLRHDSTKALHLKFPVGHPNLIAARAVRGKTGLVQGLDYRQVPVLAYVRHVPDTPWFIEAKMDQAEAVAPVLAQGLTTGAIVVLIVVIAAMYLNLLRRRREAKLTRRQLEVEAEHHLILDSLAEGVIGFDRQGVVIFANPSACRLLDYTANELIGQSTHNAWHEHGDGGTRYSRTECPILRALRTREPYESLCDTFLRRDGTELPVAFVTTATAAPESRLAMVLIFRDASEKRAADEQHRILFQQSREALMTLNPYDGHFATCNPATLAMFGVASETDFTSLGPWQLSPELQLDGQRSADQARTMIDIALRDGINTFEWQHQRLDGTPFPAEVRLSTFQMAGRTLVQATVRDVSERRRIEAQRNLAFARQKRVSTLQQSLLAERPLPEKLQEIVDIVVAEYRYEVCGIWTVNEHDICDLDRCVCRDAHGAHRCPGNDGCLQLVAAAGTGQDWRATVLDRMPFERGRFDTATSVPVRDLQPNGRVPSTSATNGSALRQSGSSIGYPLRLPGGEVMGVLAVFATGPLEHADDGILESVAYATSQAIHNARVAATLQASQKHAQREALKLRSMIEGMAEGVIVADANDTITDVNAWFLSKTQQPRDAFVGKSLWDFHTGDGAARVREAIDEFRHGRRTETYLTHRHLLGMYLALRVQPIFSHHAYRGIILNLIDVSDLERAREAAVSADRAKSQFLANMGHEIRTPMTAILGFTDILLDQITDTAATETAQAIRRNGEQLLALMQNVLDISQLEAGRIGIELEAWPPLQIVADVVSLMSVRASAKGLMLTTEHDDQVPPFIHTDPIRLRQILVNLVGNAIKFTNQGRVHLATRVCTSPAGCRQIQFSVSDSGIGIAAGDQEKIFEPFTQLDAAASRRYEGTGLGLAISRQLTHALGGELSVQSSTGLGSTFTVTLNVTPCDATLEPVGFASAGAREGLQQTGQPSLSNLDRASASQLPCIVSEHPVLET